MSQGQGPKPEIGRRVGDRAEAELDGVNGLEDDDLSELKLATRSSVLGHVVILQKDQKARSFY